MDGLKKYLIIIIAGFMGLWFISIMIYWDTIGNYFSQTINEILNSGIEIMISLIAISLLILAVIGGTRR